MTHESTSPSTSDLSENVQASMAATLRGAQELLPRDDWAAKLIASEKTGRPLRIKLGLDPTAPDIHLGHTVVLNKMRQLQDLGHTAIFLVGDFTSAIGDPSGRNATRPALSAEQIKANAETYLRQANLVLDPEKTEVRFNSEWCDKLGARGMIELASRFNVARMMERNDFHDRFKAGNSIAIHEFLYPLMQGYDSVALRADLELGGTDQKFNLLMGRHLQAEYGQDPQCILTMPLLVGTDGVDKMSKSKNNYIGLTEPANDMFSKTMRISDELMWTWLSLLSFQSEADIALVKKQTLEGRNPRDAKIALALEITERFHGRAAAGLALQDFVNRSQGGIPEDIPEISLPLGPNGSPRALGELLKASGLAASTGEGNRLIDAGGARVDGQAATDRAIKLGAGTYVLQAGKRKFARVWLA